MTFRSLFRQKGFSFINIFGLAMGLACSLLIFLFVKDEKSYDRFNKNSANIYRVVKDFVNDDGTTLPDATTPPALAPALQAALPEVLHTTRVFPTWGRNFLVTYRDKKFVEEKLFRVDSSFFDVFTFPFEKGTSTGAFKDANSIILTESSARRYFGVEDPIGKTLEIEQLGNMAVTGVVRDVPSNSHFHFDFLIPTSKFAGNIDNQWGWYNFYTYALLKPNANISNFTKEVQSIYKKNNTNATNIFHVQPLESIHLTSHLKWELEPNGDQLYVYVFTLIGLFIVLIAGINYVNLATAKASSRGKEVGVRKVIGAGRSSLIGQFLLESVITCLIASVLAVVVCQLLFPVASELTGKHLTFSGNYSVLAYTFIASALLGITSGFFPAIYLSSFKPIRVLKAMAHGERGSLGLRRVLVVIQFTISTVLIIGAIAVYQQMQYVRSANLGLNKDQVIVIKNVGTLSPSAMGSFQNVAAQIAGVRSISTADGVLGGQNWTTSLSPKGSKNSQLVNFLTVGYDFLETMGVKIKEGRSFSSKFPGDTLADGIPGGALEQNIGGIIINETAAKALNVDTLPIGKQLLWGNDGDTMYYVTIVGVARDFHFTSMRNQIKPFAFVTNTRRVANFTVKLAPDNMRLSLTQLRANWRQFSAERPFEYLFLDETFATLYESEARFQKILVTMVALGICIACLGLLGLATFAAQKRKKEIGIRKVLGASVASVASLLSTDFLKLVLIALAIATPLGWYAMNSWLQGFAYRINLHWWIFAIAAVLTVFIALFTISFQAIRSALANPVKSLRTE